MEECSELRRYELEALEAVYAEDCTVDYEHSSGTVSIELSEDVCEAVTKDSIGKAIHHLPPLQLRFVLPDLYPLQQPPGIELICDWLTPESLADITQFLSTTWCETDGAGVLDIIINTIRYDLSTSQLQVRQESLDKIISFDKLKEKDAFESHTYPCMICMEKQSGKHCIKLSCSHIHCRQCLTGYLGMLIDEGSVVSLRCPHPDCRKPSSSSRITTEELEDLMDSAHVLRYKELIDKRRVEIDGGTALASDPDTVKQMERQYGKNVLARMLKAVLEEEETMEFIRSSTQQCPTCSLAIAKSYGCNHMVCSQCNTHFCYLCGSFIDKIDPFVHFNDRGSKCHMRLFEGIEDDEQTAEDADEAEANILIEMALGND
ncbi:hypothetical protein FBU59_002438 [Linderina macrospora]|uniref:Uncharacterized protein n=1 Tax=Linderina macrospora TaxID=4868 RepID=A0ACC1JBG0_9FUNG|nr:hypothetical protein FBU59_002438 [Linderina macrospora]